MSEKLSLQNMADALAQKAGVSKKAADSFSKAFFETVVEALSAGEESIKVKGLGTFKLVSVDSRESVNVTNGERIIIPGYKKVAFTVEEKVVERLNEKVKEEAEKTEASQEDKAPQVEEPSQVEQTHRKGGVIETAEDDIEALIEVPEPTHVEAPVDTFGGIDMLISTPESVEEIRQQYEEAKVKMETAVAEARKANAEKLRLERLLERMEQNVVPEQVVETLAESQAETTQQETPVSETSESQFIVGTPTSPVIQEKTEEEKRQEAFNRVMSEPREPAPHKKNGKKGWVIAGCVLLVAAVAFFLYQIFQNIEAVEKVPEVTPTAQPAKPTKPAKKPAPVPTVNQDSLNRVAREDSIRKAQKADSLKLAEAKPARPATHIIQRGESLTRISQKYYGTKDSVRAILRVNQFADPDNVPIGAVVKLP